MEDELTPRRIRDVFDESMYRVLPDLLTLVEDELQVGFDCHHLHVDATDKEKIKLVLVFAQQKE